MQYIKTYFPNLTPKQENQFMALGQLYTDWNAKINVISRKDIENLYLHHILHSLGIAKTINFADGSTWEPEEGFPVFPSPYFSRNVNSI